MSKRRTKRPSPGSQPKKPSGSDTFNKAPFTKPPKVDVLREARDKFVEGALGRKTGVDPVPQMPGVMGRQPRRGKGFIPLSGGPKVKIWDRVGPPEDLIRKAKQPNPAVNSSTSQNSNQTGRGKRNQRVKGNYSNPADFVKPSDLLTPILGQPQKLPGLKEPYGPEDPRQGPIDTRKPPKSKPRTMKPVPDVPPVPLLPEGEVVEDGRDDSGSGVYYFDKGRFLTRGKYNAEKIARTTKLRG